MNDLFIERNDTLIWAHKNPGLDTYLQVANTEGSEAPGAAVITLTWVEAQQLHKWLGERLGQ